MLINTCYIYIHRPQKDANATTQKQVHIQGHSVWSFSSFSIKVNSRLKPDGPFLADKAKKVHIQGHSVWSFNSFPIKVISRLKPDGPFLVSDKAKISSHTGSHRMELQQFSYQSNLQVKTGWTFFSF